MSTTTRTTRRTRTARALGAIGLAAAIAVLPACGGDDDTGAGGTGRLSDEAFCALVDEQLAAAEARDPDAFEDEVFALIGGLADRAPTAELTSAMRTLSELGEQISGLDEDDPDAFEEMFALMLDPSFMSAMDDLDEYFTDTCGFDF